MKYSCGCQSDSTAELHSPASAVLFGAPDRVVTDDSHAIRGHCFFFWWNPPKRPDVDRPLVSPLVVEAFKRDIDRPVTLDPVPRLRTRALGTAELQPFDDGSVRTRAGAVAAVARGILHLTAMSNVLQLGQGSGGAWDCGL